MNKKIRVSSLSRLFGIEQESWDDYPYPNDGYFDAQLNYHFGDEYFPSILFPWEWVLFPEVVEHAKQLGVEVPTDPPQDFSRTF